MKRSLLSLISVLFLFQSVFSQISFVPDQSVACLPATINFTNTSSSGYNYYWYMGDGGFYQTTGLGSGVSHNYTFPGNFTVYVDAYDASWNYIGYYWVQITIEGLSSPLNATDNTICPGDMTSVDIGSGSGATNINWDFGDGEFYSNTDYYGVQHSYSAVGNYTVTVTADFPNCGTLQSSTTIDVGNSYPLAANYPLENSFYPYEDTICPGDRVEFATPYQYESYYMNFGDGSGVQTSVNDHIYNNVGDYFVTLTMVNGCGNSLSIIDTISVRNNLPVDIYPNSSLVWDEFCINSPVELRYPYNQTFSSYQWNLGNGNTATGNTVTTSYPNTGNYIIGLTVTNGCGNSGTIIDTVVISNSIPVTNLQIDGAYSSSICPGDGFFMQAETNGGTDQNFFTWDFGDGNTSTLPSVQHSYNSPGTYTVTLTATNFCGNSASISEIITVSTNVIPNPIDYFFGAIGEGQACPGDSVVFLFAPGSTSASIIWDFGDGNSGPANGTLNVFGVTYNYAKHLYTTTGSYNAEVTFTNGCGNSFTEQVPVNIANGLPPNDAGAFEDPLVYNCQGQPIDFISFGGASYIWNFGDGTGNLITNTSIESVQHIYENPGTYEVTVQITNGCGISVSEQLEVIIPASRLDITTNSISSTCTQANGKAVAIVEGGTSPYTYQWSNGDVAFIADSIPAGIYVVNISDKNGCSNYAIATVSDEEAPTVIENAVLDVACFGGENGAIDISVIGNSAPYTYFWSNGSTNEDVNQLAAGPHEVIIIDANDCVATKSIYVNQPDEVTLSMISQNADCGGMANGSAAVAVSGNTGPYNYVWSNGMTNNQITGVSAGIYNVVVVDANGCLYEDFVTVSEGSLSISVDSITGTGCTGDLANIYVNVLPLGGNYTYSWSNGPSSQDNMNLSTGTYSLMVTDINNSCRAYAQYEIMDIPTNSNEICVVSVDTLSNTNRVIWQKDESASNISHYNIYKESSESGVYYLVGNVPYDSLSVFTDPVSNPQVRSWRYKISVVDDCGNESVVSEEHKTIHLTVNEGINNTYNLIWDHYDGLTYSTYEIWRKTDTGGWTLVTTLPSNLNSYTDVTPPTGTEYYRVQAIIPTSCEATRAGVNTSRSNVRNTPNAEPFGTGIEESVFDLMRIYPNPTTGIFHLDLNQPGEFTMDLYNSIGEKISGGNINGNTVVDLSKYSVGIYFIQIMNEHHSKTFKLIKN